MVKISDVWEQNQKEKDSIFIHIENKKKDKYDPMIDIAWEGYLKDMPEKYFDCEVLSKGESLKDKENGINGFYIEIEGEKVKEISKFEKAIQNQVYFEDFITRNIYHSNSIEGNTISYGETYALIFNQEDFIVKAKPREIYEAINLKYVMDYVLKNKDDYISENIVKDIGRIINKNINEISGYRTEAVFIRGAEHLPPAPNQVNQAMMYLLYNIEHTEYNSIMEKCADFHIQFERIYPFSDGNGRTGRALNTLLLLKENQTPFVIPLENRPEYFKFLADQDLKGMTNLFEKLQQSEEERILVFCPELKECKKKEVKLIEHRFTPGRTKAAAQNNELER